MHEYPSFYGASVDVKTGELYDGRLKNKPRLSPRPKPDRNKAMAARKARRKNRR